MVSLFHQHFLAGLRQNNSNLEEVPALLRGLLLLLLLLEADLEADLAALVANSANLERRDFG